MEAELKLVLDAVAQLAAGGKEAFLWWLVLDKVMPWVGGLGLLAGVGYIVRTLIGDNAKLWALLRAYRHGASQYQEQQVYDDLIQYLNTGRK